MVAECLRCAAGRRTSSTTEQSSTPEDLINLPAAKLKAGGKAATGVAITPMAASFGNIEKITGSGLPQVIVQLTIGGKSAEWTSQSGTLEMKDKGAVGSLDVELISSPSVPGAAAKPLMVSGSWSVCSKPLWFALVRLACHRPAPASEAQ